MNTVKTGMLLAGLMALFGVVGYFLGGGTGMMIALGFGVVTNLFAYWNSDRLALAARCTASFPIAFEASFVPVKASTSEPLRPDM